MSREEVRWPREVGILLRPAVLEDTATCSPVSRLSWPLHTHLVATCSAVLDERDMALTFRGTHLGADSEAQVPQGLLFPFCTGTDGDKSQGGKDERAGVP